MAGSARAASEWVYSLALVLVPELEPVWVSGNGCYFGVIAFTNRLCYIGLLAFAESQSFFLGPTFLHMLLDTGKRTWFSRHVIERMGDVRIEADTMGELEVEWTANGCQTAHFV